MPLFLLAAEVVSLRVGRQHEILDLLAEFQEVLCSVVDGTEDGVRDDGYEERRDERLRESGELEEGVEECRSEFEDGFFGRGEGRGGERKDVVGDGADVEEGCDAGEGDDDDARSSVLGVEDPRELVAEDEGCARKVEKDKGPRKGSDGRRVRRGRRRLPGGSSGMRRGASALPGREIVVFVVALIFGSVSAAFRGRRRRSVEGG